VVSHVTNSGNNLLT